VTLAHAVAATVASFEVRLGMRRKKTSSGIFTRPLAADPAAAAPVRRLGHAV
jgi:hypothetical protein